MAIADRKALRTKPNRGPYGLSRAEALDCRASSSIILPVFLSIALATCPARSSCRRALRDANKPLRTRTGKQTQGIADWPVDSVEQLGVDHLQAILDAPPEVLLIGTGTVQQFPDRAVWRHLRSQGLGVEIMDTAAACRTYNLIMAEGRDVAAALIING